MGLGIPPLKIEIMLESNPLKSNVSREIGRMGKLARPRRRKASPNARRARLSLSEGMAAGSFLLMLEIGRTSASSAPRSRSCSGMLSKIRARPPGKWPR